VLTSTGLLTLLVALGFAAVHVFSMRLEFLDRTPRSRWLSFAGGVSVAYVFLHVMPELAARQQELAGVRATLEAEVEIFVIALAGLVVFYGLERIVKHRARGAQADIASPTGVFWLHIASFALYNALIGYLLVHREESDLRGLLLYALALGLHFIVNDRALQQHHGPRYRHTARWLLAAAVVAGWLVGIVTSIGRAWVAALFALLAGGVILNVLKEELPQERESRFSGFALGVLAYGALLLMI
jgi:hypothetical protein